MSEQIDKLLEDTEQHLAAILAAARKQAASAPTEASIKAAVAAENALLDYRNRQTPEEWFKNSAHAAEWMVQQGYLKKRGGGPLTVDAARKFVDTLRKDPRRGYHRTIVQRAANKEYGNPLKPLDMPELPEPETSESLQKAILRKNLADAEKKEIEVEEMRRELDRKWLYRDDALLDLAVILTSIQQALDHAVAVGADAIITVAGGDPARGFDVSEAINELIIARAFNEVAAAGTLRVKFKGEREGSE